MGAEYVPKALLPVAGRPLLEHQLEWLRRADIDSVVLCLDCQPERVRERFGDGSGSGVRLRYCVEPGIRGTAGTVKSLGPASLPEDVVILPGDMLPDTDCGRMIRFHQAHSGLATLAFHDCRQKPAPAVCRGRGGTCAEHGCSGTAVILGPGGRIMDLPSRSSAGAGGLALSPLWVIRRGLLHFVPDAGSSDFVKDVFPAVVKAGETILGYGETGTISDLGSPERYERFLRNRDRKRPASEARAQGRA
jgi:NDP-sugar pyrophosphorylase family protein